MSQEPPHVPPPNVPQLGVRRDRLQLHQYVLMVLAHTHIHTRLAWIFFSPSGPHRLTARSVSFEVMMYLLQYVDGWDLISFVETELVCFPWAARTK